MTWLLIVEIGGNHYMSSVSKIRKLGGSTINPTFEFMKECKIYFEELLNV
jgi:hypothetical protein